ncbi:MAG: hypothetical protein K2O56_06705 [Muribaculaceae bacterium]|nr:hypothetical protein [Muribaculaceae bacterium]
MTRQTAYMTEMKDITGYSHYLAMKSQMSGMLVFDGHKATSEETSLRQECRRMSDRISLELSVCKEEEISLLLECYETMYRLGYSRMPDRRFIDTHRRRILDAWRRGNRRIAESQVYEISEEARRELSDRWLAALMEHGCFPGVTAYENYQRLALIMRENLDKELGDDADNAKHGWYEHNRVGDLSTLGSMILRSYRRFVGSLFPVILGFDEKMELDNRILSELSTRIDLTPHDRAAYRMALEFNKQLAETYQ